MVELVNGIQNVVCGARGGNELASLICRLDDADDLTIDM